MTDDNAIGRIPALTTAWWRRRDSAAASRNIGLEHLRLEQDSMIRIRALLYCASLWIALPLAVFTCNGLLGLIVHCLALTGAASALGEARSRGTKEMRKIQMQEGEATCAAARIEKN